MLKKLFLGCAAAALAALPAWADDASANGARAGRRVPVWQSQEDGSLQPDATYGGGSSQWNSPTSSDGQTRMNSRMAERLRAARRTTSATRTSHNVFQEQPEAVPGAPVEGAMNGAPEGMYGMPEGGHGMHEGGHGSCDMCGTCGDCPCSCCCEFWQHKCGVFADYLYLHPTGADLAYGAQAVTGGGPIATPGSTVLGDVPFGRVGVADPEGNSGYRTGFTFACDSCSSWTTTYTQFESSEEDALVAPDNNLVGSTVNSLVLHPGTLAYTNATSLRLDNYYDIDFKLLDVDYSRLIAGGCNHYLNYVVGVRWANLEQNFSQLGDFAQATGVLRTSTDVDFDGAGLRIGLDGRRRMGCGGWSFYGKGLVSVVFGEFSSTYTQFNETTDSIEATSNWNDDRVVPILEYELGLTWSSRCDRLRVSAGYYTAFWFNTVTTGEWINAVQNSNLLGVDDTIAFDGLTTRVEYRF